MASPSLANTIHILLPMILATALAAKQSHVASAGAAVLELRRKVRLHGDGGGDHLANLLMHNFYRHLSGIDVSLGGNPVGDKIGRARPPWRNQGVVPPNIVEKVLIPL